MRNKHAVVKKKQCKQIIGFHFFKFKLYEVISQNSDSDVKFPTQIMFCQILSIIYSHIILCGNIILCRCFCCCYADVCFSLPQWRNGVVVESAMPRASRKSMYVAVITLFGKKNNGWGLGRTAQHLMCDKNWRCERFIEACPTADTVSKLLLSSR